MSTFSELHRRSRIVLLATGLFCTLGTIVGAETAGPVGAVAHILFAGMVSPTTFAVRTVQNSLRPARVRVSVAFPGMRSTVSLEREVEAGLSTERFAFNLRKLGAPRFRSTVRVGVVAVLMPLGQAPVVQREEAVIPLPVVVVHGLFGGRLPRFERSLVTQSRQRWGRQSSYQQVEGGSNGASGVYPTVFFFSWADVFDRLDLGAKKLSRFIETTVKPRTYADKVIIVSHSRGANLTRYFLTYEGGASQCAGAVLAAMPGTGAIPRQPVVRPVALAQLPRLAVPALDLLPTWPWWRATNRFNFSATPDNRLLRQLNNQLRPANVPLRILYGDGIPTANTRTGVTDTFAPGDGVVTRYSATGAEFVPNARRPAEAPRLRRVRWFRGLRNSSYQAFSRVGHQGFLEQPAVQRHVFDWLDAQVLEGPEVRVRLFHRHPRKRGQRQKKRRQQRGRRD